MRRRREALQAQENTLQTLRHSTYFSIRRRQIAKRKLANALVYLLRRSPFFSSYFRLNTFFGG